MSDVWARIESLLRAHVIFRGTAFCINFENVLKIPVVFSDLDPGWRLDRKSNHTGLRAAIKQWRVENYKRFYSIDCIPPVLTYLGLDTSTGHSGR